MEKELLQRIEELEKEVKRQRYYTDMMEIQQLKARYIYLMENFRVADVWEELFVHDDPEVSMEMQDAGTYIGPERVKRAWYTLAGKLDADGNPVERSTLPGQFGQNPANLMMLTLTTPYVVVAKDGKTAVGDWHVFGPHAMMAYDPAAGCKKMTAYWLAGKFHHEFVKVNGQWKIKKFRAICWLRADYHKGWLECPSCRQTPIPFYPPDVPGRFACYNPDDPINPDKWGPMPPPIINYNE